MKKQKWLSAVLAFLILLTAVPAVSAEAESNIDVTMTMEFRQTEARKMVDYINEFRQGSDTWAWSENDSGKIQYVNLQTLTYDYNLERIAMQRAAEIALNFSHKRPNGKNFRTVTYSSTKSQIESISMGTSSSYDAYLDMRADHKGYSGQEARRNMLNSQCLAVGIGHVVVGNTHFWTQEYGLVNSQAQQTSPMDGSKNVRISVSKSMMKVGGFDLEPNLELIQGKETDAPWAKVYYSLPDTKHWDFLSMDMLPQWQSADSGIVKVSGQKVVGAAPGSTTLKADIMGLSASVAVTVKPGEGEPSKPGDGWKNDGQGPILIRDGKQVFNSWAQDTEGWVYLDHTGHLLKNGWVPDSRDWCYMDETGHQKKSGWAMDSTGWCYLKADGYLMRDDWAMDSVGLCYVNGDGHLVTNSWLKKSGSWCFVDGAGRQVRNGWARDSVAWCYLKSDGLLLINGVAQDSHGWCYLGPEGRQLANTTVKDSTGTYVIDANGYITNM